MVATDRVTELFTDAGTMHSEALERLPEGSIRDATEKAWCATKRVTDALILAWTGEGPTPRHRLQMGWTLWRGVTMG